jgi:hypothetical protein
LTWKHEGIPAAVLQQLGDLQGLTALTLHLVKNSNSRLEEDGVEIAQLAALLRQLTALRCLQLQGDSTAACSGEIEDAFDEEALDDSDDIRELLQAICSLQQLSAVRVELGLRLPDAEVTQLNDSLPQLLCGAVAQGCSVSINVPGPSTYSCTPVLHIHACHEE